MVTPARSQQQPELRAFIDIARRDLRKSAAGRADGKGSNRCGGLGMINEQRRAGWRIKASFSFH